MTLTKEQFSDLVEAYTNFVVDGMDLEAMASMVYETLETHFSEYTDEQLINEIVERYDEEVLESLGVSVPGNF
jgi:predicted Zn-dependent protease with MMP-like domain